MHFYLVHPCDRKDNGGCNQVCDKEGDNKTCSCDEGFELLPDGVNCKECKIIFRRRFCFCFSFVNVFKEVVSVILSNVILLCFVSTIFEFTENEGFW